MADSKWPTGQLSRESCVALAIGAAAGAVVGWLITAAATGIKIEWLGLITALATAGAVIAAVWLGLREGFWRRHDQKREREIVWKIVRRETDDAWNALSAFERILDSWRQEGSLPSAATQLTEIENLAPRLGFPGCWQLVDKLPYLPGVAGASVATLMADSPRIVEGMKTLPNWQGSIALLNDTLLVLSNLTREAKQRCEETLQA